MHTADLIINRKIARKILILGPGFRSGWPLLVVGRVAFLCPFAFAWTRWNRVCVETNHYFLPAVLVR